MFRADQRDLDPHALVFINETAPAPRWSAFVGEHPAGAVAAGDPGGHWKATSFIGALRLTGMTVPIR